MTAKSPLSTITKSNKRSSDRRRTLFGGKVAHLDGGYCMDCVIRNISATGARVRVAGLHRLPDAVYLIDLRNRVAYEARVAWRRTPEFGLRLVSTHPFDDSMVPDLYRLVHGELQSSSIVPLQVE